MIAAYLLARSDNDKGRSRQQVAGWLERRWQENDGRAGGIQGIHAYWKLHRPRRSAKAVRRHYTGRRARLLERMLERGHMIVERFHAMHGRPRAVGRGKGEDGRGGYSDLAHNLNALFRWPTVSPGCCVEVHAHEMRSRQIMVHKQQKRIFGRHVICSTPAGYVSRRPRRWCGSWGAQRMGRRSAMATLSTLGPATQSCVEHGAGGPEER